ncbi:MAG TPA: hypothetical protein VG429_04650 [Casimicrobiaceae bacterium]|jgi:hypothetical protein|nr:hypothetical protein [Casimicrobiaceae bacterium]
MLNESPSSLNKVVTSLKVAALLTVLGAVVLAAGQRLGPDISPGVPAAASTVPAPQSPADGGAQPVATNYFPAQFPAPSGPVAEQPPTF